MNLDELWRSLEAGDGGQSPEPGFTVRRIDPDARDGLFAESAVRRVPACFSSRSLSFRVLRTGPDSEPRIHHCGEPVSGIPPIFTCPSNRRPLPSTRFSVMSQGTLRACFPFAPYHHDHSGFLGRLDRWKRFFEAAGEEGLSEISAQDFLRTDFSA